MYLYNCGIPFARGTRIGLAHCHFGRLIVRAGLLFEKLVVWIGGIAAGEGARELLFP
jgi:hypothetical protein